MPLDKAQIEGQVRAAFTRSEQCARRVGVLYDDCVDQILKLVNGWPGIDPSKPFSFAKYPALQRKVNQMIIELNHKVLTEIQHGMDQEWEEANKVSDAIVRGVFDFKDVENDPRFERYFDRNLKARDQLKSRIDAGGLGLSDRIWNYGGDLKAQMDAALQVAITQGKSSQKISQEVRQYLNEPDRLFRRVRDSKGKLQLSKAARAFHPGRGVYRSAYRNAMRMARTETNMAYKAADMSRYQNLDFVVGYEVKLSRSHPIRMPMGDICFTDWMYKITTSTGQKNIKDIKVGDLVLTHKGRFRRVNKVYKNFCYETDKTEIFYDVPYDKNRKTKKISATSNHPFLINGEWKPIFEAKIGDEITMLAVHCKTCDKLIPVYRDYCSKSCASTNTITNQWKSKEFREQTTARRKKLIEENGGKIPYFKEWIQSGGHIKNLLREDVRKKGYATLSKTLKEKARRGECPLQRPGIQRLAAIANGKAIRSSFIEKKMAWLLGQMNIKYLKGQMIKRGIYTKCGIKRYYLPDFILPDYNIIIECDGEFWHKNRQDIDKQKDIEYQNKGYQVLRFIDGQIRDDLKSVASEIQRIVYNHEGKYEFIQYPISNVRHYKRTQKTPITKWNLGVEEDNSYIVNNIVVHNCDRLAGKYPKEFKFVGWHPQCYSDDTEVLTERGWLLFKDVNSYDNIFSLNPDTRQTEWVGIVNRYKYLHSGSMIRFHNRSLDMLVTPDHRMVYQSKLDGSIRTDRTALKFDKNKGWLYRSSVNENDDIPSIKIGEHTVDFDSFCEFMAYYLSDGSLSWTRNYQLFIACQKEINADKYEIIGRLLSNMPFTPRQGKNGYYINDRSFYEYLKQFGKSADKHVPDEIKQASKRQIQIFMNAYVKCDGHVKKKIREFIGNRGGRFIPDHPERMFFTCSDQMAADLGELLVKLGKRPSYKLQKGKGIPQKHNNGLYFGNYDCWRISECHSETATVFEKTMVPYAGFVYDLELKKNHILYIRRNGKCIWGSNCMCYVTSVLATDQEMDQMLDRILKGEPIENITSSKRITDVPDGFKRWVDRNMERSHGWKSQPYFIHDNFKGGRMEGGMKLGKIEPLPVTALPVTPLVTTELVKSGTIPDLLNSQSEYVKGTAISFNKRCFDLVNDNKPVTLKITTAEGRSHFDPADFSVNIFNGNRTKSSMWYKESVVYHEFGHAIDWQRNLKTSHGVLALMNKYRDRMMSRDVMGWVTKFDSKEGRLITTFERGLTKEISHISRRLRSIYERFDKMDNDFFVKRGIVKRDILEQIMAASDTIQSLNPTSGMGHGISYMIQPGNAETEFIAHCFENAFIGNQIFKKYMPELYDDMIKLVNELN